MSAVVEGQEQVAPERVERWVSFELDGQLYGLDVLEVQEVLRVPDITPTAGAPECVLGVINLRGNIVTVVDLRRRFDLPPGPSSAAARVIILDLKPQQVGVAVDRVGEIVAVTDTDLQAPPMITSEASLPVRKVLARQGALVFQIDSARLLELPATATDGGSAARGRTPKPPAAEQDLHAPH
ncbi:MAG TPA: chemotaxis protein CheW [Nevskiaceae bacterium]|nr:chemotaxis protein CheW [Nevskiaceae bacterium]